ncbi:DUF2231 domain-containing protein [Paenibacillus hexagrammi]|uniref:DUF2231 domain-containing protein n=1 Tax=Paenibacillus hexagrammi TaxID=2908839 RepID=A0ABY3SID2_9BACL|nr:DUF2231 domain-containing protein [Paenibacillus sp. YPD9-1]UJF33543.1 hypothetical protein L0M14_29280 [Paenibacillus sp. YPD9-1]
MDYLLRNSHFIFTHFPIALLIFSFVFDLLALILKKKDWHSAGMLALLVGTLGAIASFITGPEMSRNPLLPTHALYAQLTMIASILLSVIRIGLLLWKKKHIGGHPVYLVGALVAVLLVSYTGHLGGKMVHRPFTPGMNMQGGPGQGPGQGQGQGQGTGQGQGQGQG